MLLERKLAPLSLLHSTITKTNALYDAGAGASLINYSAYVSLGQDLDTGYKPFVKNTSGEDMGALGQITCTFTINNQHLHNLL